MPDFSATHQHTADSSEPIVNITGGAAVAVKLWELILGSAAVPDDAAIRWQVKRTTTTGTGTSLTIGQYDPASATADASARGGNFTTPPTETGPVLLELSVNQRATFRWVALTDKFLQAARVANNGLVLRTEAVTPFGGGSPTPNVNPTVSWNE